LAVAKAQVPAAADAQAPHLAVEGERVRLTWFEPKDQAHALKTALLAPDGSWSRASTIVVSSDFFVNWADTPSVTLGGDGTWLAHFAEKSAADTYAYDVVLATSPDGEAWTRKGPVHDDGTRTEHGFVSTWPTSGGVGLVWLDGRRTASGGPMTLRSGRVPGSAATQTVLDDRVCDCCGTTVAIAPDGVPVVAYRDRTEDEVRDIFARRLDAETPTPVGSDGWQIAGCPVNGPRLATSGSAMLAAWATGASGSTEVRVSVSLDGARRFASSHVLAAGDTLGRVDVVPLADGAFVVTWLHDVGEGKGEVRARRVSAQGELAAGPVATLGAAASSRAAGFPRAVRRGGDLVVVWTSPGEGLVVRTLPVEQVPRGATTLEPAGSTAAAGDGPPTLPTLTGTDMDGAPWVLRSGERPTLVALWASWCAPCRAEVSELVELAARDDLELVVVAVDDRAPQAVRALAGTSLRPVFVTGPAARDAFGASTVPAAFLFGPTGRRLWQGHGALSVADVDVALAQP